ncbi:MAG: O-antigen ligase family protein [Erysipelotrichaceae bacterium]|nr:O-antigen ligase family protein [Erysipelotrichaceae bacterium]
MKKLYEIVNNRALFLVVLLFSCFYNALYYQPLGMGRNYFFYLSCIWALYFLIEGFLTKKINIASKLTWSALGFLAVLLISTFINFKHTSMLSITYLYSTIMYIFVVYLYQDEIYFDPTYYIIVFLFIASLISLLMFLFGYFKELPFAKLGYRTVLYGIYNGSNATGFCSAIAILLSLKKMSKIKLVNKWLAFNIVIQSMTLWLSRSQNSIVFLVISFVIYFILKKTKIKLSQRLLYRLLIIGVLFIVVMIIIIYSEDSRYRFFNHLFNRRVELWLDSSLELLKQPILGYGVGTFNKIMCGVKPPDNYICVDVIHSGHNVIFDVLFYGGVLGIITFGWFVKNIIHYSNLEYRYDAFVLILFILMISMFDYSFLFANSLTAFVFFNEARSILRKPL